MSRKSWQHLWIVTGLLGAAAVACTSPVVGRKPVPVDGVADTVLDSGLSDLFDVPAPQDSKPDLPDALSDVADVAADAPDAPSDAQDAAAAADASDAAPDAAVACEIPTIVIPDDVTPPLVADLPLCTCCTWTHLANMNKLRQQFTGDWLGDQFYVWGGYGILNPGQSANLYPPYTDGGEATGEIYDPKTDKWTMLPQAPLYPSGGPVVAGGDRLYVYGGQDAVGKPFSGPTPWAADPGFAAAFDPTTATWTALPTANSPGKHQSPQVAWTGSELLVWDGYWDGGPAASYDPLANAWTPLPPAPVVEATSGCSVWTGTIWLIPELDPGYVPDLGVAYAPTTKTWTTFKRQPPPSPIYPPKVPMQWSWTQCVPLADGFIGIGRDIYNGTPHRLLRYHLGTGSYDELSLPLKTKGKTEAASIQVTSMHIIGDWLIVMTLGIAADEVPGIARHLPTGTWYRLLHPHKGKGRSSYASGVHDGGLYIAGGYGAYAGEFIWKDSWKLTAPWSNSGGKP